MAYSYTVDGPRHLPGGAVEYIVYGSDLGGDGSDKFHLDLPFKNGHIVRLVQDLTTADGVSTLQGEVGEADGWTTDEVHHVYQFSNAAVHNELISYRNFRCHIGTRMHFREGASGADSGDSSVTRWLIQVKPGQAV